jgi:hypothetical protein
VLKLELVVEESKGGDSSIKDKADAVGGVLVFGDGAFC